MRHPILPSLLAALLGLTACDKARTLLGAPDPGNAQVPTGDPAGGPGGPTAFIQPSHCTPCHGTPGLELPNADPLVSAAPPRALLSEIDPGVHRSHLVDGPFRRAVECASCHLLPTAPNAHPAQKQGRVSFSRLATTSWTGAPVAPVWDGATCAGTYCHGNFKNGANAAPAWAGGAGTVVCGSCHGNAATGDPTPSGTHPSVAGQNCGSCHGGSYNCVSGTACTSAGIDAAFHMNGVVDGGGESGGGTSCGACHSATWNAMNGSVAKAAKHALLLDVPVDDGVAWTGAALSGVPASSRSCVNMCHGDHPHDLTSPVVSTHENNVYCDASTGALRGGSTRTRSTRADSDFDGAAMNGGLCASCHQKPVTAGGITVTGADYGASAHDYVGTETAPVNYAAYGAWSYPLHDGGTFRRNCTKCHASNAEGTTPAASGTGVSAVHFGDNASLLSGTKNPGGTAAGFVCYNCHGSTATPADGAQGNRSGKDIQSQIAHATTTGQSGHPAISDSVHDSAAEYASAAFGNALGVAAGAGQRHASCLDCHDPHGAEAGPHAQGTNVAGPPLQGAWGAKLGGTLAAWAAPTSANFTKTVITAGTDLEATLCFKCHSAYYGTLPTSPSSSPAFTETDQAREFNPANPSFHPVLASAGSNQGATGNILAPWTRTSLMTCTDCHESDVTTDPSGPHGSGAKFILKGPNTTWSSAVINTSAGMPAGTFCANCHAANFANSRFPGHTNGRHNVACFACHVAIPHGSGHMGMLASVSTGGTPAGGVQVTDSAPYASGVRLGIFSYPSATATWGNSNCGCDSVSNGH